MPLFKRKDGDLVPRVHPLRRMMPFLMPSKVESFLLYMQPINAARSTAFLQELNAGRPADRPVTRFHLLLQGISKVLRDRPRMNRFLAGGRLYQRRGTWISFAGKQSMDDDAPLFTLKRAFSPDESLLDMVSSLYEGIHAGRSGQESATDKEVSLLLRLPAPLLRLSIAAAKVLDNWNLLPQGMIAIDPLFSSVFVANLGSLGIDAAYHHNYEYGNCPVFITIGRVHKTVAVASDGTPQVQDTFELKLTYDERIADGFYCAASIARLRRLLEETPEELL